MQKSNHIQLARMALRSSLALLLTVGIAKISFLLFTGFMLGQTYFSEQILNLWKMGFFLLLFQSIVFVMNKHDTEYRESFLERKKNAPNRSPAKLIVTSIPFYVDIICITLLSLLLPTAFIYDFVGKLIWNTADLTPLTGKLYTLACMLPLLVALDLIARLRVAKQWGTQPEKDGNNKSRKAKIKLPPTLKGILTVVLVYCGVSAMLPWFFPVFHTLWKLGGKEIYFVIFGGLTLTVLVILAKYYLRAVLQRKVFIKQLKQVCAENDVSLSEIKRPYRSVFFEQSGSSFQMKANGITYDCKLIAGIFPGVPIIFSANGIGVRQYPIRLLRTELFQLSAKFDFSFESNGKKLLIVLPNPHILLASANDPSPTLTGAGKKVGDYTVYTENIFFGALERNCL